MNVTTIIKQLEDVSKRCEQDAEMYFRRKSTSLSMPRSNCDFNSTTRF